MYETVDLGLSLIHKCWKGATLRQVPWFPVCSHARALELLVDIAGIKDDDWKTWKTILSVLGTSNFFSVFLLKFRVFVYQLLPAFSHTLKMPTAINRTLISTQICIHKLPGLAKKIVDCPSNSDASQIPLTCRIDLHWSSAGTVVMTSKMMQKHIRKSLGVHS